MRNTALLPYPQHINIRPNTYSGGLPFDRTLMYQAIRGKLNNDPQAGIRAQAAAVQDDELFRLLGIEPENSGKPARQAQTDQDDEMDKYFGYKKPASVANGGGSARMVKGNDFPEHNSTAIIASDADLLKYLGIKPERTAGYSKPVELTDEPQARGVNQVPVSEALENLYPFITDVSPFLVDRPVDTSVPPSMRNQQLDAMTSLNSTPIGWQPNASIYGSDSDPLLDFISKAKSGALASVGSLVASLGALMENAPVMTTISNGAIVDDPSLLDVVQKNLGKVLHKAGSSWRDDSRAELASLTEGNAIKVPFYGDLPTSSIYEGVFDPTNYIPLGAGARVAGKPLTTLKNILKQGAKAGAFSAGVGAAQIYGDDSLTPEEKQQHVVLDGLVGLGLGGISSSMLKARAKVPGILNEHPILKITGEQGIKEIENSPILRSTFAALSKNPELIENKDVRTVLGQFVYNTSGQKGVAQLDSYIAKLHIDMPRKDIPDYFVRNDINSYFTPDNKRWENSFQSKPGQHKSALDYPYGTSERTRPYVTNSNTPAAPIEAYDFPYAGGSRPINKADDVMETLPSMLPDDPRVKWVAFAGKQLPLLKNDMKIINFFEDLYPDGHLTDYLKQNNMNIQGFIKKHLKEVNVADYSKNKAIEMLSGVARNTDLSEVNIAPKGIGKSRGNRPNTEQLASIPLIKDIVELGRVFRVDPNLSVDGAKIYHLITPLSIGDSNYFAVSVVKGYPNENGKEIFYYYTHKLKRVKNTGRGYDMADWLDNVEDTSWLPSDMSKLYK